VIDSRARLGSRSFHSAGTRMYSVSSVYAKVDRTPGRRCAELVREIVVGHLRIVNRENYHETISTRTPRLSFSSDRRPFACDLIFPADCVEWVDDRAIFETLFSTGLLLKLAQNDRAETWWHIIGLRLLGAERRCHARVS